MRRNAWFAVAALSAAMLTCQPETASAQEAVTVNGTTISFGGGAAYLDLPDVEFTGVSDATGQAQRRIRDNEFSEYGSGFSGSVETPVGYGLTAGVRGFYSAIDGKDRSVCRGSGSNVCSFSGLNSQSGLAVGDLASRSRREVDHWGAAFELTRETSWLPFNALFKSRKVGAGFDIRGLDQDLTIGGKDQASNVFSYDERLDANYYGGYVTAGGEYSLGGPGGLWDRFGLRSFATAHAGIYGVDVDYDGALTASLVGNRALSLSDDDVAFIGGLKLETRKQISPRMALSLFSEYEYYSWVPQIQYGDSERSTSIRDDDAFASRTSLRLTIGLGDDKLYSVAPEPFK